LCEHIELVTPAFLLYRAGTTAAAAAAPLLST
jgi:hypothetical protein